MTPHTIDKKRFALMVIGNIGLGAFLSLLLQVGYGTDTGAFLNSSLSRRTGVQLGTVMLCFNSSLFIPELIWGRKYISYGTLVNMVIIGYVSDFCTFLENRYIPGYVFTDQPYRTAIFIGALAFFLASAAIYMNADMGLAPFDAIPKMLSSALHIPFCAARMSWDFLIILAGILVGGHLPVGTAILAFTIGPAVSFIGRLMREREIC